MKRELTAHRHGGLNDKLHVAVLDEPGHGGANHRYVMFVPHDAFNQELNASFVHEIRFQRGPLAENGINGISNEALLAIVQDRLRGFQSGEFACDENQLALDCVSSAIGWLQVRTDDRLQRGVEGTSEK